MTELARRPGAIEVRPNYYVAGQRPVVIEDAQIFFRNFAGKEKPFNKAGDRNFCVELPPNMVGPMQADGFNVKQSKIREEGDEPRHYIAVNCRYDTGRPPRIVLINGRGRRTDLHVDLETGDETLSILDFIDIARADLIINPYNYNIKSSGARGITAYCQTLFVFQHEDYLERKYGDLEYETLEVLPDPNVLALEAGQDPNIVDAEIVEDGSPAWDPSA